jgi:hypothetical protein
MINCVIEAPSAAVSLSEPIVVSGWTFGNSAVQAVAVSVDAQPFVSANHGLSRPDVGSHHPNFPGSPESGFRSFPISLNEKRDSSAPLEVVVRVTLWSGESAEFKKTVIAASGFESVANRLERQFETSCAALLSGINDLSNAGEIGLATKLIEKYINISSSNVEVISTYGTLLLASGRFEESIRQFEAAQRTSQGRADFSSAIAKARHAMSLSEIDSESIA